ncbi:protein SMAX1-LIKE 6-like isoform X1 [Neltuma alba]|uniref:protein SMAX1-LIKE 6-like isoform X1 n=1 Tax=Neltuma alba TaxID=207710 RepID=UPI0010A32930|nr:protein SMAX1-LIKE 6-like isoform X1 [Prosopis alba]XP_028803780.1 protein SMAX1-LIKE 6-like isoform X1 [Prosopis alba]
MPTPVGVAKQCLTPDASRALEEAVSVARRRGHPQTTSLHAVSALLSLPSSTLRDACARARSCAYSPRLQFKALELCLSVSLDRVPSTQLADDPPVSNSLMAAIRRSQASQRRQPENFHIYHQISQQPTSVSCVKVELQHLILSILDDPVVSRVFGEAGFRSSEIKLAILRPLPQLLRYSRSRVPPIFLCNLTEHPDPGRRSFSFPFPGSFGTCDGGAENYKRIGDLLCRSRGRNPLLLGVCADDALRSFTEDVNKQRDGILPVELSGLRVTCIGTDISKFVLENSDNETFSSRLKEIAQMIEQGVGPGLVANFGDLKSLVDENASNEAVNYVVAELAKLLELNYGKFWLMGAAASYESYLKFMGRFPSIEKDWDLQLLPITSTRPQDESPRHSLMDSFVPFGGLFSSPSNLKGPLHGSYYCVPRCLQCGGSCVQEVLPASNERLSADPYQSNLPPWLGTADLGITKGLNGKTKEDSVRLDTSESGPIKKLDKPSQHLHDTQQFPEAIPCQTVMSSRCSDGEKEDVDNHSRKISDASPSVYIDLNSSAPIAEQMISTTHSSSPVPVVSKSDQDNPIAKAVEILQKTKDLDSGDLGSCNMSNSSMCDGGQLSPSSVTSVTTDLGIGISFSPTSNKSKNPTMGGLKEIASPLSSSYNLVNRDVFKHPAQSSSCLSSDHSGRHDLINPKILLEALAKKVTWQVEALQSIVKAIAYSETSRGKCLGANQRGAIWMNFVGTDRIGKKKIAVSLAEILYGSQESFIFVDLNREEINGHDAKFRGKTILDVLVGELCKNPLSVVFLDNVDMADMMVQNSLSQAIKTGKIIDSCGREVGANNAIIVTSFSVQEDQWNCRPKTEFSGYSEERISRTKGAPIKIKVEHVIGDTRSPSLTVLKCSTDGVPNPIPVNKRKLSCDNALNDQHKTSEMAKRAHKISNCFLDLNAPAEENELQFTDDGKPEGVSTATLNPWLQELYNQVDETIILKPYNFDALADRVLNIIRRSFHSILGSECSLQIESEVMEQLLAAAYVSERDMEVEDWVEQVLTGGFTEIQQRYSLSARSIVKLATCQEQAPGVSLLPPRIIVD